MNLTRVLTILMKDLRDAIRDARVLVALLLPLAVGVFYNLTFDDTVADRVEATVVYAAADETQLPALLQAYLTNTADLDVRLLPSAEEVRQTVADDNADIGLIVPAGFDRAVAAGQSPEMEIVTPPNGSLGGDYVQAGLGVVLRQLAGQTDPAQIAVTATESDEEDATVFDRIGAKDWALTASLVMMLAMISMLAVPIVLAEEAEKKTLDALTMIASYTEVVAGKALLGAVYAAVMVPVLLVITGMEVHDWPVFVVATTLLTLSLIGFGLLMAGLFKSANQLNTWAGIFLLPVVAPAFAIALPMPDWLSATIGRLPTGEGTKLLLNAVSGKRLFGGAPLSMALIAVWAVLAYALLLWRLGRTEA